MQLEGKELCDLLVGFENHIIIFSDKDCVYRDHGDAKVNWRRWYKKAIQKSAEQLIGAKNWITRYPDRISLDAKCSKKFPLKITITAETTFHLIAIAHGATESCKKFFSGGDGGLIVDSSIVGDMHINEDCAPFVVGQISGDPKTFIHIFDDTCYINILRELDTIQDFLRYLETRRELLTKKHVLAECENDVLAYYLRGLMKGKPQFLQEMCKSYANVRFESGLFEDLKRSQEYADWRCKIKVSHFWDELLQKTFFFIENGLSDMTTSPTLQEQSELFKLMAREDRIHRCILAENFLSFLAKTNSDQRGTRILFNADEPDVCYILFLLPRKKDMGDDEYRNIRREMLKGYCTIVKAEHPNILHVIGVAHESADEQYSSEDFIYLDARDWSEQQQAEALVLKEEYILHGLLAQRTMESRTFFPDKQKMKGRDRNKPCPCGSGKKFKNCCGK